MDITGEVRFCCIDFFWSFGVEVLSLLLGGIFWSGIFKWFETFCILMWWLAIVSVWILCFSASCSVTPYFWFFVNKLDQLVCRFNTWFSNPWSSSISCPCRIGLSRRFRPVASRWRCPDHSIWFRFHPRRGRIRCTCMWIPPHLTALEIRVQSPAGCIAVFCCLRIIFHRTIRRRFSNLPWDQLQCQKPLLWLLWPVFPGGSWPRGGGL